MSLDSGAMPWLHLDSALAVIGGWLVVGAVGVVALRRFRLVSRVLFPLGGALGAGCCSASRWRAVFATPEVAVLPLGLPTCRSTCASTRWRPSS